jgi:hypothetical protein
LLFYVKKLCEKVWWNRKKYAFFASAFRKGGSVQRGIEKETGKAEESGFSPGQSP